MIPGFVVSPEGPKTVLVRVVGPSLGGFGVAGTMVDPKLTVYSGSTAILANDNWSDNPDAALVVTLPPDICTVIGSSAVAGGTGVVLVEVYVVP